MDAWQTLILAFGGNAALLAVLGFLAKSLIEKLIVRDTKVFEADLKYKTDTQIEKIKSEMNRTLESYKIQLKKSEVFFLRELEAAASLSSLFHSILPSLNHPEMDWHEACDVLAQNLGKVELRLNEFMDKHGAVLDLAERRLLIEAINLAANGKFDAVNGEVSSNGNKAANDVFEKLAALVEVLLKRVRSQATL